MGRTEQLATGIAGLDRILCGGLRAHGMHLIVGMPGTGKTVLAHQIGSGFAAEGKTVLYLTALVESHETLLSQASTFSFFDPGLVSRRFYYASVYPALERGSLQGVQEEITRLVRERAPDLVVIDGLHVLRQAAQSELQFHRILNTLQAQVAVTRATMLLISNIHEASAADARFTVSDAIFRLALEHHDRRDLRTFRVEKLRGVEHIGGSHVFTITSDGIRLFPRLEAVTTSEGIPARAPGRERMRFGIPDLDAMLRGGLSAGSITLLSGVPGAGKTLFGLAFLAEGARQGENGLYVGFHETPDRLVQKAENIGVPAQEALDSGRLQIIWKPATELLADQVAEEILTVVDEHGIRRVVIDALEDVRRAAPLGDRELAYMNALTNVLRARGIAVVITQTIHRIFGLDLSLPMEQISAVVDNIILLRYIELRADLRRMVSILKVREHEYDSAIRQFTIAPDGISVGAQLDQAELLLTGLPRVTREDGV